MVFLSDGRTAYSAYGDVQMIRAERVEVFGSWFPVWNTAQIVKRHPEMVYHPMTAFDLQPIQTQQSFYTPLAPPAVIVNPNRDYRDNLHNIKTGGFNQEAGQPSSSWSSSVQY
jgi:hypothetical protein